MGRSGKRKYGKMKLDQLDLIWTECFSKIFKLPITSDNDEPLNNEEIIQFLDDMQSMKVELNSTKCLLNSVDIVKWHQHTKSLHLCGQISTLLMKHVKAELVTQAWAKFHTILNTFNFFRHTHLHNINTVHLCEAPGSFITSLNHYLKGRHYRDKIHWNWTATTLNPYYEGNDTFQMIDDDRFIIETLNHWEFGPSFTGDIMTSENLNHMKKKFKDIIVTLVTADGSWDCSENPGEQEKIVGLLFLWEVITALSILSDGGSFVLKMFTVFEKITVSLLYLLYTVFRQVTFIKPGPSKPGNSEVYVVCENFRQSNCLESPLFTKFLDAAIKNDITEAVVTFDNVPNTFMHAIMQYAQTSSSNQIKVIKENLQSFNYHHVNNKEELREIKDYIAKRFLEEFSIYPIEDFVAPLFILKTQNGLFYDRMTASNFKRGSFNDRLKNSDKSELSVDVQKVIDNYKDGILKEIHGGIMEDLHMVTFTCDCFSLNSLINFKFIKGKKAEIINSSCFISSAPLKQYYQSRNYFTDLLKQANVKTACYHDNISYQHELNKLDQCFPMIGLMKKKNMLFISNSIEATEYSNVAAEFNNYFKERDIDVHLITANSEPTGNVTLDVYKLEDEATPLSSEHHDTLAPDLVICDFGSVDMSPKLKKMNMLKELFNQLTSSQTLLIRVEGLVFSSFWHGILFLISSLYKKMMFVESKWSEDLYYFIFLDCNVTEEIINSMKVYLERLSEELSSMGNECDIFHIVDIYLIMQSGYRKHMISRNEYFTQAYIEMFSKLF